MEDGDTGEFTTFLLWDEVTVTWTWCAGDDWEADGYFDIFVYKDGINITYEMPKQHFQWIESEVKQMAGYEPPTKQAYIQARQAYNSHF